MALYSSREFKKLELFILVMNLRIGKKRIQFNILKEIYEIFRIRSRLYCHSNFILIVTTIVTTRSFSPKIALKKIFPIVFIVLTVMIILHYNVTISRMSEVEAEFTKGETILCENRTKKRFLKIYHDKL